MAPFSGQVRCVKRIGFPANRTTCLAWLSGIRKTPRGERAGVAAAARKGPCVTVYWNAAKPSVRRLTAGSWSGKREGKAASGEGTALTVAIQKLKKETGNCSSPAPCVRHCPYHSFGAFQNYVIPKSWYHAKASPRQMKLVLKNDNLHTTSCQYMETNRCK